MDEVQVVTLKIVNTANGSKPLPLLWTGPRFDAGQQKQELTLPTKVPSDSLGWIGSLKRITDKSLFPMALGNCGHRITHQLRPINMNGRSILSVMSELGGGGDSLAESRG